MNNETMKTDVIEHIKSLDKTVSKEVLSTINDAIDENPKLKNVEVYDDPSDFSNDFYLTNDINCTVDGFPHGYFEITKTKYGDLAPLIKDNIRVIEKGEVLSNIIDYSLYEKQAETKITSSLDANDYIVVIKERISFKDGKTTHEDPVLYIYVPVKGPDKESSEEVKK